MLLNNIYVLSKFPLYFYQSKINGIKKTHKIYKLF